MHFWIPFTCVRIFGGSDRAVVHTPAKLVWTYLFFLWFHTRHWKELASFCDSSERVSWNRKVALWANHSKEKHRFYPVLNYWLETTDLTNLTVKRCRAITGGKSKLLTAVCVHMCYNPIDSYLYVRSNIYTKKIKLYHYSSSILKNKTKQKQRIFLMHNFIFAEFKAEHTRWMKSWIMYHK